MGVIIGTRFGLSINAAVSNLLQATCDGHRPESVWGWPLRAATFNMEGFHV